MTAVGTTEALIRRLRTTDREGVCAACLSGTHNAASCSRVAKVRGELVRALNAAPANTVYSQDMRDLLSELDRAITYSASPIID
jgi:hypothetical protein